MNKIKFFIVLTSIFLGSNVVFGSEQTTESGVLYILDVRTHFNILLNYIVEDKTAEFNKWFDANKQVLHHKDVNGETLLFHAIHHNRHEIVKALLEAGAHVNVYCNNKCTPLYCTPKRNLQAAKLLLDHKADVNLACFDNNLTPLMVAVRENDYELTELLLRNNAKIDEQLIGTKLTALMLAIDVNCPKLVELLLKYNPNPHLRSHTSCSSCGNARLTACEWAQSGVLDQVVFPKHNSHLSETQIASNQEKIKALLWRFTQLKVNQQTLTQQDAPRVMSWTTSTTPSSTSTSTATATPTPPSSELPAARHKHAKNKERTKKAPSPKNISPEDAQKEKDRAEQQARVDADVRQKEALAAKKEREERKAQKDRERAQAQKAKENAQKEKEKKELAQRTGETSKKSTTQSQTSQQGKSRAQMKTEAAAAAAAQAFRERLEAQKNRRKKPQEEPVQENTTAERAVTIQFPTKPKQKSVPEPKTTSDVTDQELASSCLKVFTAQHGSDKKTYEGYRLVSPTEKALYAIVDALENNHIGEEDFSTLFGEKDRPFVHVRDKKLLRINRAKLLRCMQARDLITIDEKDINGPLTPLMIACAMKEENASLVDSVILERAIAQGNLEAILNARSATGKTAKDFAFDNKHINIIRALHRARGYYEGHYGKSKERIESNHN